MDVEEIARSILNDEFWDHEPLLYTVEDGRNVVIEGNRRLAAVMVILDADLRRFAGGANLPPPGPNTLASLKDLPAKKIPTRFDAWRFIGFKHVSGPVRWTSYAKAQYIDSIHREIDVPLEEIAKQLGDTSRTVERLYNALQVIHQAERAKLWSREFAYRKNLAFSHLMTGLDYSGFQQFLGVDPEAIATDNPVPAGKLSNLSELCIWLWGDQRTSLPPIIKSQNPDLRNLDRVLQNAKATERLRSSGDLQLALESTKTDEVVLRESISTADNSLRKALASAPSGYSGEPDLLYQASEVSESALSLYELLKQKRRQLQERKAEAS